jgi:hypothetical protein
MRTQFMSINKEYIMSFLGGIIKTCTFGVVDIDKNKESGGGEQAKPRSDSAFGLSPSDPGYAAAKAVQDNNNKMNASAGVSSSV